MEVQYWSGETAKWIVRSILENHLFVIQNENTVVSITDDGLRRFNCPAYIYKNKNWYILLVILLPDLHSLSQDLGSFFFS